jgi:hypothetical protein
MRAAFGLVGILITLGVIIWIMAAPGGELQQAQTAINVKKQVEPQVNQIAGNSASGDMRFNESAKFELQNSGGRSSSILVTEVDPRGPAAQYYGLVRGDSIVEVGQLGPVRDNNAITSSEDAMVFVMDAYQRKQPLVVVRDGQRVTLPAPGSPGASGKNWVPSH